MSDSRVEALNAELGNAVDPPEAVARALLRGRGRRRSLGRLEAPFAHLNALLPGALDAGLARQLPVIRRCARS